MCSQFLYVSPVSVCVPRLHIYTLLPYMFPVAVGVPVPIYTQSLCISYISVCVLHLCICFQFLYMSPISGLSLLYVFSVSVYVLSPYVYPLSPYVSPIPMWISSLYVYTESPSIFLVSICDLTPYTHRNSSCMYPVPMSNPISVFVPTHMLPVALLFSSQLTNHIWSLRLPTSWFCSGVRIQFFEKRNKSYFLSAYCIYVLLS